MNVLQKLTTVIQMHLVATHCFLTVVRVILVILGMDFPAQVVQFFTGLNCIFRHNSNH